MANPGLKNWIKLTCLGLIWGASFMFMSIALQQAGPLFVAAGRLTLGAIILLGIARARGASMPDIRRPDGKRLWMFIIGMALFTNAAPFVLLAWAQQTVPSAFAGVCMAIVPLFTLPLAHLFVPGEHMTLRRVMGFVIGTTGVVVLIGPAAFAPGQGDYILLARLACVVVAGCYATGSILTRLAPETDRLGLAATVLLVASLMLAPYALIKDGWPATFGAQSALALLYLGVLPTALAQVMLVQVIRDAGPTFLSLVNYQVPVWSVIFGAILLNEPLQATLFIGLVLILSGLVISQWGALTRLMQARKPRPET